MTDFLEAPEHKYVLEPDNPRLGKNLNYIEMFEIEIINWEGKFKLSQDKKPNDTIAARKELIRANEKSIKLFLDKVSLTLQFHFKVYFVIFHLIFY